MSYATFQQIRRLGVLRPSDIDRIEVQEPGITMERAEAVTATANTRLSKRYRTPFNAQNPPIALAKYVAVMTTYELLFDFRGVNPDSDQKAKAEDAMAFQVSWLKDAVDSKDGDAELRAAETGLGDSAVNAGGPLGYSEASPYSWMDVQRERLRGGER